jgi:putative DNA primase/helicase
MGRRLPTTPSNREIGNSSSTKLVPALSLICHLADGSSGFVGTASVRRAIAWADYLETHARRAYGSVTSASVDTAKAILAKIRSGHLEHEFRSRDVWRPQWSKLTDSNAVNAALSTLVEYEWLAERKVETMGRPATVYVVNPTAMRAA